MPPKIQIKKKTKLDENNVSINLVHKTEDTDKLLNDTPIIVVEENKIEDEIIIKEDNSINNEVLLDTSKTLVNKYKKPINKNVQISTTQTTNTNDLFNIEDVDYRNILLNYDFTKNKTLPKITKYEKALLIGKRAKQIEEGANPNVKVLPGQTCIEIAEEELRQRKIPLIIRRPIGNKFEYWHPKDMEVLMD